MPASLIESDKLLAPDQVIESEPAAEPGNGSKIVVVHPKWVSLVVRQARRSIQPIDKPAPEIIVMPSCKSPSEIVGSAFQIAKTKGETDVSRLLVLGFLAGAYIALGSIVAIATGKAITAAGWAGLSKLVFAGTFPVGLMLVVIAGAELFTGNVGIMTPGLIARRARWAGVLRNWIVVYVGNALGSLFVAYFLGYLTQLFAKAPYLDAVLGIASAKVTMTFGEAFWRGVGCNWMVCLAVWLAVSANDVGGKVWGIWFPIMAFVAIGFEHCVANMFFVPLAIFYGAEITWGQFLAGNLLPVTLGNIVGGSILVGGIYWWLYGRQPRIRQPKPIGVQ